MISFRLYLLMSPGEIDKNFRWIYSHRKEQRFSAGRETLYPVAYPHKKQMARALAPGTY